MSYLRTDPINNFCKVTVSTTYNSGALTVVLAAGNGANLPWDGTNPFNLEWWDVGTYPDPSDDPNKEIVQVTNVVVDTITIVRGQEGTTATNKNTANTTYKMQQSLTKKSVDQIIVSTSNSPAVNNSMTLVADADLQLAIGANETWEYEFYLPWKSASADLKYDISGPAAPTQVLIGSTKEFYPGANKVASAFSSGLLSASNSGHASGDSFIVFCTVVNGANAGTIQLQYAQWAMVAENTVLLAGRRMKGRRIQ